MSQTLEIELSTINIRIEALAVFGLDSVIQNSYNQLEVNKSKVHITFTFLTFKNSLYK